MKSPRSTPHCIACAVAWLAVVWIDFASAACDSDIGGFVSLSGAIEVQSAGTGPWTAADLTTRLCEGDSVRVGERSRAAIALANNGVLRLDQTTTIRLLNIAGDNEEESLLELVKGVFQSFSRKPHKLTINTPYLNGSIEGTEFIARAGTNSAEFTVFEGIVVTSNAQGRLALKPGESARATAGQAPSLQLLVKPRDGAQWALYYPPVLSLAAAGTGQPALQEAATCAAAGNTPCAFAALEALPPQARDANFHILRAALLLGVGQVDDAKSDLAEALARAPESARALALRSVIAVVLNDQQAALTDAERAIAVEPSLSAGHIALSYARQATLDLQGARAALRAAVEHTPDDALAWARLAEIELMLGARRAATIAAGRAAALRPDLSRTQTVLGFAALAAVRFDAARSAFEQAIAFDSADPLPHLGRGLAHIRAGELETGRRDLEAAVALDSSNALLRAYLGKAYFEERRGPLDAEQFAIARELDPLDPTAYLYEAISLQSGNEPVRAFRTLEASIARNDNRAVYRSRLLLDGDRAARGTSLARVYKDLGFNQLGLNEATRSMGLDPANSSAHRFLSDVYRDAAERVEIARVSELLQAQLLQDVNINPIQPSLSSTNLNVATSGGPSEAGFNEFTSLFERNQLKFDGNGFGGTNNTVGGETVLSGIYGPVSASTGYFKYDTDGFRSNNDLEHDIANAYVQWAVSPELNLQTEYLWRDTEHGDLRQNFDLDDRDESFRRELESHVWRTGARYSPTQHSDFLFSYIHSDVDSGGESIPIEIPDVIKVSERQAQDDAADQFEGQYLYRAEHFNLQAGAAHADADISGAFTSTALITAQPPALGLPPLIIEDVRVFPTDSRTRDTRGYIYTNIQLPFAMLATLGASYQDYDGELTSDGIANKFDRFNPKVGIRWNLMPNLTARAAYFETVKPVLVSNRTLEPTQVAGFNQFFDDPDATRSDRYGAGLDWRPLNELKLGGELTRRQVESPVVDFTALAMRYENRDEWLHRAYVFWEPAARWALSAEGVYDKFTNAGDSIIANVVPHYVRSWTVPVKVSYFDPLGWFASLGATYVDQTVRRNATQSILAQGTSDFALFDLAVGYRLPARRGMLSVVLMNLFDKNFDYQDNSYRTFSDQPYVGPYVPERVVMARMTVSF